MSDALGLLMVAMFAAGITLLFYVVASVVYRESLRRRGLCVECRSRILFSARSRGDGLCGTCSRRADGTSTLADALREWQDAGSPPPPGAP